LSGDSPGNKGENNGGGVLESVFNNKILNNVDYNA
jgi:gamma-tubulin complex component 3